MKLIKTGIKLQVTPEESKQVQEICFANGIDWWENCKEVAYVDAPYLIIINDRLYFKNNSQKYEYKSHHNEEVDAKFFIKTNGSCIEENQEQFLLKQNIEEEQMKETEVETYKDVKEYLVAKGLYARVMEIEWDDEVVHTEFNELFIWADAKEGYNFWNDLDDDLIKLRIEKKIESLVQDYKSKQGKEFIKHNEVETYIDVKDYLIAKGLYERVLGIAWKIYEEYTFSDLFMWSKTEEGHYFWDELNDEMLDLDIYDKVESLVQDYKAKQCKEFIKHIETQPEEAIETKPLEKPKQYLVFVPTKGKPKHIHQSLDSAQEEAKRLCKSGLCDVMVLEVVSKYQAKVIVEEIK